MSVTNIPYKVPADAARRRFAETLKPTALALVVPLLLLGFWRAFRWPRHRIGRRLRRGWRRKS